MKRKYEALVTFLKINAVLALVIGLIMFIFGLDSLTRGAPDQFLLLSGAVGLLGGGVWSLAAGLELLSDIEVSIRKPESEQSLEEVKSVPFGDNPYNRPHALKQFASLAATSPVL